MRIQAEKVRKKAEKMRLFAPESGLIKGLRANRRKKYSTGGSLLITNDFRHTTGGRPDPAILQS
jgi:hypothetical protein